MRKVLLVAALILTSVAAWSQQSFFEAPRLFTDTNTRFPQVVSNGSFAVAAYQRIRETNSATGTIEVVVQTTNDGLVWSQPRTVASGIRYEGSAVPPVFHVAVNRANEILVATVDYQTPGGGSSGSSRSGTSIVSVQRSTDLGASFREVHSVSGDISLVSPRVFASASGGWFLTMERFDTPSNRIVYSYSPDGRSWPELLAIPVDVLQTGTQSDVEHVATGDRDILLFVGENIVPPAVEPGEADIPDTPQIYAIYSDNGGRSWSATDPATGGELPGLAGISLAGSADVIALAESGLVIPHRYMRITHEPLPRAGALTYQDLVMRRPSVEASDTRRLLAFELGLRLETDSVRQVAVTTIDRAGNINEAIEILSADGLRRTDARIPYHHPTPAIVNGSAYIIAYQEPGRGGRIVLYERTAAGWVERSPSSSLGVASFPTAATINGRAHFFWHRRTSDNSQLPTRIAYLEPDQRALPPRVEGGNFRIGRRSASSTATFTWTPAPDAAGIVGYAYEWSRDPEAPVPVADDPVEATSASLEATEDGEWYLRIRALDRAGNWSPPRTAEFYRDTTPPSRVSFLPPPLDEDGFLTSNTFTLRWRPPEDDVIGGYYTDLVYVADETEEIDADELPLIEPPERSPLESPSVSRDNYDNGLWALSVAAVDSVGNVGEPSVLYVRMNKYIPVTEIYTIAAVPDPLGRYNLSILGRGFTANGRIDRVVLDKDRQPPYDYVFDRTSPGYRIFSDRNMAGPLLDNLNAGEYFVGLVHTERGLEFSPSRLQIERNGTVKFGDYTVLRGRPFELHARSIGFLDSTTAIAWIVVFLMFAVAIVSGTRLVAIGRDSVSLRLEAQALVASRPSLIEARQKRIAEMRNKGIGLRLKFTFFVVLLVMGVVGMVSVSLGSATLNSQQLVLLRGLKDRVDVLMENLVSDAAVPLLQPEQNTLQLDSLPVSVRAMDEAHYATITGPRSSLQADDLPQGFNYVWGTNDPRLLATRAAEGSVREELLASRGAQGIERAPVPVDEPLFLGRTSIDDPISDKVDSLSRLIDRLGAERLNTLVKERARTFAIWNTLRQRAAVVADDDPESEAIQQDFQRAELTLNALNDQITNGLEDIVTDALVLLRWAEARAIDARSGDGANTDSAQDAVSQAIYEIPDSYEQIEADLATARQVLAQSERFSDQLTSPVKSYPVFVAADFDPEQRDFLFYQPVVEPDDSYFPTSTEAIEQMDEGDLAALTYFRGTVRIGVATDLIIEQIDEAREDIIRITVLIALAAIGGGIAGAIVLATIVVIPINKLVRGVEYIRRTQDKSTLKDHSIKVRSRDELFRLADSINTMTVALAAAAEAEKDLIVTSDLQKKFIPLEEKSEEGRARKLTMAHMDVAGAEFHGYYEGADALSGDYFTYEWIDRPVEQGGSVFAMIKCDVSGHGVNAAFIMVEVATIFLNRVRDWRGSRNRPRLAELVNTVNDLLVERGFQNMFAAMTVAVIDTSTGEVRMTHGGDTEQRIYRAAQRTIEEHNLNQAPATGMFDREIFPPGMEYTEFDFGLDSGDIMILATDGIEESARLIRDDQFEPIPFDDEHFAVLEQEAQALDPVSSVDVDKNTRLAKEEFSTDRIRIIVERVQAQDSFRLQRVRNYDPSEQLVFNYRGIEPTARNTVLAIMAAEKVFRLTPDLTVDEPIRVDREIDEFLRNHFSAYRRYFAHPIADDQRPDATEKFPRSEYVYYTHLREEEQSDDLTILTVRKK